MRDYHAEACEHIKVLKSKNTELLKRVYQIRRFLYFIGKKNYA